MTMNVPLETTTGLQFRLRYPNGRTEKLIVDADRALIGSAAHCEVRLPPEAASPEHVEVFSSEKVVHLNARVAESPPLLDGVAFTSGPWPPGQLLTIGGIAIDVVPVDLGQRRRGRSPFWLLAPVPIIAVIVTILYASAMGATDDVIPDAPPLFDPPITTCPTPPGDQLAAYAADKMRLALAKRERGPFVRLDDVDAVPLFEIASACFKLANDPEDAQAAKDAAVFLRKKLEDEYMVRRVRLEHWYRLGDPVGAKRELTVLVPMTTHRKGPYVEWLGRIDRTSNLLLEERGAGTKLH